VWHIQNGQYSDTVLDSLNVLGLGGFTGNLWAGEAKDAVFGFLMRKPMNNSGRLYR